jgi:nucleotide-binding universal stress UspA family protein
MLPDASPAPAHGPAQDTIVVGWDGSEHAEDAFELGRLLTRATSAKLVAAEVTVERLGVLRRGRREAERPAPPAAAVGGPRAIEVDSREVVSSSPAHGLHDLAEELGAGLVVLGSTHRGPVGRVFLGSVADNLVHGAPCAVAVAPNGYARRYANRMLNLVVVGFDASPEARAAAEAAARIAAAAGGTVRVVAVQEPASPAVLPVGAAYDPEELMADEQRRLERELTGLLDSLPSAVKPEGDVVAGDAVHTLLQKSAEGVDLLVVGSRGYGPVGRTLLGSVSSEIIRSATCPVMVVPRGTDAS